MRGFEKSPMPREKASRHDQLAVLQPLFHRVTRKDQMAPESTGTNLVFQWWDRFKRGFSGYERRDIAVAAAVPAINASPIAMTTKEESFGVDTGPAPVFGREEATTSLDVEACAAGSFET